MACSDPISGHEQLDHTNYPTAATFSIALEPHYTYLGLAYLPPPRNELVVLCNHHLINVLEFRRVDGEQCELIRSIELNDLTSTIDDFVWCPQRQELLIVSSGQLVTFDLENERVTNSVVVDADRNKCRLACNASLIACADSRTLKLFDINTLKCVRQKRLDHVCEDIEFDDHHFVSTHTGKLEFLDRTLFSIRRYTIGGTAICRFNSQLWLLADAFDDRLLWQSLDKLLLTVYHIHQPKAIVVIPSISRIVILGADPDRLLVFDPVCAEK